MQKQAALGAKHLFLSTPSARRATGRCCRYSVLSRHFYPRPPRGGRPKEQVIGDVSFEFLSTPSARRATPATSTPMAL